MNATDQVRFIVHFFYLCLRKKSNALKATALILASWMLPGGLFPRTDFSQLLRLRAMAEHYRLHQREAAAMGQVFGLFDFLWLHFVEGDSHRHADGRQHEELPLHHLGAGMLVFAGTMACGAVPAQVPLPTRRTFSVPAFCLLELATDIFRPPARF